MSYGNIWNILKETFRFKAWTPKLTQELTPGNMESRLAASTFWLTFTDKQFERILFSDEKSFILNQSPNKKNDVCWGPVNPNYVVPFKKAHEAKIIAWVGSLDDCRHPGRRPLWALGEEIQSQEGLNFKPYRLYLWFKAKSVRICWVKVSLNSFLINYSLNWSPCTHPCVLFWYWGRFMIRN